MVYAWTILSVVLERTNPRFFCWSVFSILTCLQTFLSADLLILKEYLHVRKPIYRLWVQCVVLFPILYQSTCFCTVWLQTVNIYPQFWHWHCFDLYPASVTPIKQNNKNAFLQSLINSLIFLLTWYRFVPFFILFMDLYKAVCRIKHSEKHAVYNYIYSTKLLTYILVDI